MRQATKRKIEAITAQPDDDPPIKKRALTISPPSIGSAMIQIEGTEPLVINKFSNKAREQIRATQESGQRAKKGSARVAKNFEENFRNAIYTSAEGWHGIPAAAFRNAMISACRMVGFKMTIAKMSVFTVADGYDADGTALVKITHGEPRQDVRPARNASGVVDLRSRPMWLPGWRASPRFNWDEDQFSDQDVANLLARVGMQVGICEGRPDSKMSAGMGWGLFKLLM